MQSFVERPHFCSPLWPHGVQGYCSDIARSTRSEKCSHKQVNSTSSCIALNPVIFFWGRPLLGSLMWKINPVLGCSEESNIDVFHPVCRCCTACWFLLPLAISAARAWCGAHKQPFFQLFNKSCANFLQISPRHGCYNLQASFAESRQAIVCTGTNPLQQLDFLKGLGTCIHSHVNSDICTLTVVWDAS